jgi:cell division protein FtsI/penicillin-binding protein 2
MGVRKEYAGRRRRRTPIKPAWAIALIVALIVGLIGGASIFVDAHMKPRTRASSVTTESRNTGDAGEGERQVFDDFSPRFDHLEEGRIVQTLDNGDKAILTVDPILQTRMAAYLSKHRVPYGVFVAVNPTNGKLLALVEYSAREPKAKHLALRATYPAASIIKLVTTAALLEKKKANPGTVIAYHGSPYATGPRVWHDNPKRDRIKSTLAKALADSNNVVFSKAALRWLTGPALQKYGEHFRFNQPIAFEMPVQTSRMRVGAGRAALAKTAAGFGEVTLSPLHGALIAAALANNGAMMSPCLVDRIVSATRETVYQCQPKPLTSIVSAKTAESILDMMGQTPLTGTSRKAFHTAKRDPALRGVSIGGKTGSLTGDNPPGKYSWFVGMAPLESPEIAVAALIINDPHWKIKASALAREGFSTYFGRQTVDIVSRPPL